MGFQGLTREVQNFCYYATRIARGFNEERYLINNNTGDLYHMNYISFDESHCRVTLLIDRSVNKISTTGTWPNGKYFGTIRKARAHLTQRAIYLGYK